MSKEIICERVELFEPNATIHMLVDITGEVSENQLIAAVKKAFEANESLNSKIVIDHLGNARYEKVEEQRNTVTVSHRSNLELQKEQERLIFRLWEGEFIRVFILNHEGKKQLMMFAHHFAGDGKSIVYFLEDVMKALNGEPLLWKPLVTVGPENLPEKSKLLFGIWWFVRHYNRLWRKNAHVFTFAAYEEMFHRYWENKETVVLSTFIDPQHFAEIRNMTKKSGVTINTFLTTAFLQAYQKPAKVGFAVDVRKMKNRNMGNQTTGISINYQYDQKKSFMENAKIVQAKIHKRLRNEKEQYFVIQFIAEMEPTLIDAAFMSVHGEWKNPIAKKFANLMGYTGDMKELSISNLTKLDIETTYGAYGIENFVFIPPVVSYGKRLIGIATLGDTMNITLHFLKDKNEEQNIQFFEKAISCLHLK